MDAFLNHKVDQMVLIDYDRQNEVLFYFNPRHRKILNIIEVEKIDLPVHCNKYQRITKV